MNTLSPESKQQLSRLAEALYTFSSAVDNSFAEHLRSAAVELAGALELTKGEEIAEILKRIQGMIALGEKVGGISANDADVIAGAITRSGGLLLPEPAKEQSVQVNFADIAAGVEKEKVQEENEAIVEPVAAEKVFAGLEEKKVEAEAVVVERPIMPVYQTTVTTAADRQNRIVAEIRQNPEVRMRDLLAALPGVSERTIRYDLERLVSSGIIEREGVGGPATRYRVRAGVTR